MNTSGRLSVRAKRHHRNKFGHGNHDFKPNPEIFDLEKDPQPTIERNVHNLPIDPVANALLTAMGLNLEEIVESCGMDDEKIEFIFTKYEAGPHRLKLPSGHPARKSTMIEGVSDGTALSQGSRIITCNDENISIVIGDGMKWRSARTWPAEGGAFTDKASLVLKRTIPEAIINAYKQKADEGSLIINQIMEWETELPKAKVEEVHSQDDMTCFYFNFPGGQDGRSHLE